MSDVINNPGEPRGPHPCDQVTGMRTGSASQDHGKDGGSLPEQLRHDALMIRSGLNTPYGDIEASKTMRQAADELEMFRLQRDATIRRNMELRKALEPFARIGEDEGETYDDYPDQVIIRIEASVGEIRRARETFNAKPHSQGGC